MKFFYAPRTISLAAHIALEEAGVNYDLHEVDFSQQEQRSEAYLQLNPKGRVPTLETDRGIITETAAILLYLAQAFPRAQLAPVNDPFELAKIMEFNTYLASTVHVAHAHRVRGERWVDDEAAIKAMQAKVPQNMSDCFRLIETQMFQGPWVMGEEYTICDPYLFSISTWLEGDSVDLQEFPQLAEHHRRMRSRPAVERVLPLHGL